MTCDICVLIHLWLVISPQHVFSALCYCHYCNAPHTIEMVTYLQKSLFFPLF